MTFGIQPRAATFGEHVLTEKGRAFLERQRLGLPAAARSAPAPVVRSAVVPPQDDDGGTEDGGAGDRGADRRAAILAALEPSNGRDLLQSGVVLAEGPANELAAAAVRALLARDGSIAGPLVVRGATGLGKTHLLAGAVQLARKLGLAPDLIACHESTHDRAFDHAALADVVVVDDLGRAPSRTLAAVLPRLLGFGREAPPLLVALEGDPRDLVLPQHIVNRLAGGVVVELAAPDLSLRRAIVRAHASRRRSDVLPGIELPDAVVDLIAEAVPVPSLLIGAVNRVRFLATLGPLPGEEGLRTVLSDLVATANLPRTPRLADVLAAVARRFGVSSTDIVSQRRTRNVVRPRQVVAYLAKELTPRSLPEIGRRLGGRDHTTILHAVRKVGALIAAGDDIAVHVKALREELTR